jgi:hypothetical protein
MNRNTVVIAIAVIVVMPFIYLLLNAFKGEELPKFRGREVVVIDPGNGTIDVPSAADAAAGKPLTASFTNAFVEQVTSKKMTNTKALNLTLHTISEKFQDCGENSTIPEKAGFKVAQMCAPFAFEKLADAKKTALFIEPTDHFVVFGKSGQNAVRVYHSGMIATYDSADMTQSDRKYEACLVRIMMDYLLNLPLDDSKTCVVKQ